jgi:hypothetical protein
VHLTPTTKKRRIAILALVAGPAIAVLFAAAVPTYSIDTRHTGTLNDRGFPRHYTDDRGVKLRLCEDGTRRCRGAVPGDLVPNDGEAFYWMATTSLRSKRGPISVEFALEAAFGSQGRPIVFQRIRIRGHLGQKGRYVLLHPYGRTPFRAISAREQRNVDTTHDRFCSVRRNGRCPGKIRNFLRAKNPPRGYVGFAGRKTLVKGGTFRNSMILKTRAGKVLGQTRRFNVMGEKASHVRR